jgi:hypothetical protein
MSKLVAELKYKRQHCTFNSDIRLAYIDAIEIVQRHQSHQRKVLEQVREAMIDPMSGEPYRACTKALAALNELLKE